VLARLFRQEQRQFKKIDSTLRGQQAAEKSLPIGYLSPVEFERKIGKRSPIHTRFSSVYSGSLEHQVRMVATRRARAFILPRRVFKESMVPAYRAWNQNFDSQFFL
jgi:hypothetical protein